MDIFSPQFFTSLAAIVLIDLVLAGDNALVIGLVGRIDPAKGQATFIRAAAGLKRRSGPPRTSDER